MSPKIVLPEESIKEANSAAVRAALAHEWAHIHHGDLWLLAIERMLVPLLAVHPLFWWLRRSIRLDQELLADAAAAGDEPAEYAEALLVLARTAQPARHGLPALSMWEHPSTLSRRVAMILDPKSRVTRPLAGRGWPLPSRSPCRRY
jgi:beta-lactamase regulating signal transducer with metallopeptidase domain